MTTFGFDADVADADVPATTTDSVYTQRNALAIGFAKAAIAAGWNAGRGYDDCPEKGWDEGWRHVVYVDLPDGRQVSWHVGPDVVHLLDGLPQYNGKWDGTSHGKDPSWCDFPCKPGVLHLPPYVQRMVDEHLQLNDRIRKLRAFLDSRAFADLPAVPQQFLNRQLAAMVEYDDVLATRIEYEAAQHGTARSGV